jgi:transcriptional regulator with XRE-family HTH domain
MKHKEFLKDLHIGKIIKEIAQQKGVSSKQIAAVIRRYETNADKIFRLEDMDIEDIVHISYLLEYNILDYLVKKYLSHLPANTNIIDTESCLLKIDMRTQRVINYNILYNCDFLKEIDIGQHIRKVAKHNSWSELDAAKRLNCSQGTISNLYKSKSLKLKPLILISNALQFNFIAELYLPQIMIIPSHHKFDNCMIILNNQQVTLVNPIDRNILMAFQRNDDKKHETHRRKTNKKT